MFSPFGDPTASASAAWHSEPRGRGTFNILSSCLTTMILCVWTAVHLNIPERSGTTNQKFLRKPGWLLLALLAPEIVAWNAWEQRQIARELKNDFIKAFDPELPIRLGWIQRLRNAIKSEGPFANPEQECTSNGRSKITMVHGFYAAMGGYVIRTHLMDGQYPITGQGRLTLTKNGIQWLLKYYPGVFPDLTEAEILDKSKASTLIKTLTCLQALWFCLQCIVRLTMNTSISLLELNVFGHCICTFIIYAIWWNKPMDIAEPTVMGFKDEPEHQGLVALLCSLTSWTVPRLPHPLAECAELGYVYKDSRVSIFRQQNFADNFETRFSASGRPVRGRDRAFKRHHTLDADGNEKRVDNCAGLHIERLKQLFNLDASLPQIKVSMYEDVTKSTVRLTVGTEQAGLSYYLSCAKLKQLSLEKEEFKQQDNTVLVSGEPEKMSKGSYQLERSFLKWLDLESRDPTYLKPYPWIIKLPRPLLDRIHDWTFKINAVQPAKRHLRFPSLMDITKYVKDLFFWIFEPEWLAVSAAAFVYGGLHLLAWSAPFHAPIYGLLWKISGITITSLGISPSLILLYLSCQGYALGRRSMLLKFLGAIVTTLSLFGMLSFILLYIFARVYVVVESFLSLAYLPESVLVTPNFSLYFPHIG